MAFVVAELFVLWSLSGAALIVAIYLLVQFILALVRRRKHRSWSIVWLTGLAVFAIGALTWNAFSQIESDSGTVASFTLTIFGPFGFMLAALLLFQADRRRQKLQEETIAVKIDQPEGAWPPAPKSGDP